MQVTLVSVSGSPDILSNSLFFMLHGLPIYLLILLCPMLILPYLDYNSVWYNSNNVSVFVLTTIARLWLFAHACTILLCTVPFIINNIEALPRCELYTSRA